MPVAAMRAGDVVVAAQRLADADGDGFLADVEVREARHQRARVEIVDLLLEQANRIIMLPVHAQPASLPVLEPAGVRCGPLCSSGHFLTPDIWASTSNITAKSFSTRPMARAAVRNSLAAAVVGSGTSSCAPQFQRQQHVLLHHVHVEPRLVRHLQARTGRGTEPWAKRSRCASERPPRFRARSRSFRPAARLRKTPASARRGSELVAIFITSARPLSPT